MYPILCPTKRPGFPTGLWAFIISPFIGCAADPSVLDEYSETSMLVVSGYAISQSIKSYG
jgi:hypothetical protein